MALYGCNVLSKFHPIHCKALLALSFVLSVHVYVEAIRVSIYFGLKTSGVHDAIPFLLEEIGLDDMFDLVSAREIA